MDISGHNLNLLVSLSILLDEKNVTRASRRLGISQPALSAQLARLRDVFDDQLLIPALSGKGMVLTPRAAVIKEPLRARLLALGELISSQAAFRPDISTRTFTIGANDNASAILAPHLIASIKQKQATQINLAFRTIDPLKLADQLESGGIDIALVSGEAAAGSLSTALFISEEFKLAQRKGHPRSTRPPSLEDYARLEHVIVSGPGGGFRGFIDDILKEHGFSRRVAVSVQYYNLVPLILQATDLVCTLPTRFIERFGQTVDAVDLPFKARDFCLYATWHPRFDHDPGHQWLREQIIQCGQIQASAD